MTLRKVAQKIQLLKENYINNNINSDDLMDGLDDLVCEIEECEGAFGMGFDNDDHYGSFEETDFTKLVVD